MHSNDYVYKNFIKIILPICMLAFVVTIASFEYINHAKARASLAAKLDTLSSTYSLLYAEPVAFENDELIRSYSIALITDPDVSLIRVNDLQGDLLDEFTSGQEIAEDLSLTSSINFANGDSFGKVGSITIAVSSEQIEHELVDRLKSVLVLLAVLVASVMVSVGIAFQHSIDSSLRRLSHQASHDPLTDLMNRRQFETILAQAIKHRRMTDLGHKLLYLDLDGFKQINDINGHHAGDELLKQIAQILKRSVRNEDTIARLGGDEFSVLLLNCKMERALVISEKIRSTIAAHEFIWNENRFHVGVSIGVASIGEKMLGHLDFIKMADEACYAAKHRGKNCIQLFETPTKIAV